MVPPYVSVADFENRAQQVIEKQALDYYNAGAGEQFSLNLNSEAFKRIRIRPRCLRNVSEVDTTCRVLGCDLKWPLGIAPTAMQKMAHPEGEIGNAKAVGDVGSIFILSTLATTSIEDVAKAAPHTHKWFQLYVYKNRDLTEQLVRRAEKNNFKALVLTVDAPVFGQRWSDARNNFSLPSHLRLANFPTQSSQSNGVHSEIGTSGINTYVSNQFDSTLTWKDIEWLVKLTYLPVIVKGILTAEDAILAREFGCVGLIVSNHGARQLDGVPAPIEVLPEIVKAVGDEMVIMLDGGVRHGIDVFRALALGAKMVFLGRPALWGLGCGGTAGVKNMLEILKKDFDITMALAGCKNLNEIQSNMVVHESYYSKL